MKTIHYFLGGVTLLLLLAGVSLGHTQTAYAADFNPNNLISDGEFVNIDGMSVSDIQRFLDEKGGFLKGYSENGRSAAQIIYDASHGHGEASGPGSDGCYNDICINTRTGTVNPKVLLVTLQKEQGLLTMSDKNDDALSAAMGYGCPDSGGCSSQYAGFTNQVEWAAWQFRYNYEGAGKSNPPSGFGDYVVGRTVHFYNTYPNPYGGPSEQDVHIDNRATASLYRYTPHVYNGNYNFWRFYDNWFGQARYSAAFVSQSGYPELWPGEATSFEVKLKNTGSQTWRKSMIHLGTSNNLDRISGFLREGNNDAGWVSGNRISMVEDSVAPGDTGTFRFYLKVPDWFSAGSYREWFRPVADGECWMNDLGIYWDIRVKGEQDRYHYQVVSQNDYPTLSPGQSYKYTIQVKNTGNTTWNKYQVNLAPDRPRDRITGFIREDLTNHNDSGWYYYNRIYLQQDTVAPGETGTFSFWMTVPNGMAPGTYREYFRMVADNITWMEDYGVYWDIRVQ